MDEKLVNDAIAGSKEAFCRLYGEYKDKLYRYALYRLGDPSDAEDAVAREVREELGLTVETLRFNHSRYYPRTNTLMLNFTVTVAEEDPHPNWEVDAWRWFTPEEARASIKPGSLAAAFLNGYLDGGVYDFSGC